MYKSTCSKMSNTDGIQSMRCINRHRSGPLKWYKLGMRNVYATNGDLNVSVDSRSRSIAQSSNEDVISVHGLCPNLTIDMNIPRVHQV